MSHRDHQTILMDIEKGWLPSIINPTCSSNSIIVKLVLVMVMGSGYIRFLLVLVMVTSWCRYRQAVEYLGYLVPLHRHQLGLDSMISDAYQTKISNECHMVS